MVQSPCLLVKVLLLMILLHTLQTIDFHHNEQCSLYPGNTVRFHSLNLGVVNVNSLSNKLNFNPDLIITSNLDILAITETWLLSTMPDSFVNIDQFTVIRNDVEGSVCKHSVCIYIQ